MNYFKTYKKDGVILFDIALIDACIDESSGVYYVESNIPTDVLELALPNYLDKIHKMNHLNKEAMDSFLNHFCEKVYQLDISKYFFWPDYSASRFIDFEKFYKALINFDFDSVIKLNQLYSKNKNRDDFYFFSHAISYCRLFETKEFNKLFQQVNQNVFEINIPKDYSVSYFEFREENNLHFIGEEKGEYFYLLLDLEKKPLMAFLFEK